jgi:hypothetical protein
LVAIQVDKEIEAWVNLELSGYPKIDDSNLPHLRRSGRRVGGQSNKYYTAPLDDVEEGIKQTDASLNKIAQQIARESIYSSRVEKVPPLEDKQRELWLQHEDYARVLRLARLELHSLAIRSYHRFTFFDLAGDIFARHMAGLTSVLRGRGADVLARLPTMYERLAAGGEEEISQALGTCRRMIAAFADAVLPARCDVIVVDGATHELGQKDVLNRIHEHLRQKCSSASRVLRLARTIRSLHERVSAGMKVAITAEEAESLCVLTCLTLGEIAWATNLGD